MPLFDTPKAARELVTDAEAARDSFVSLGNERRRRMAGRWWRKGATAPETFTNSYYNIWRTTVPSMTRFAGETGVECDNPGYGAGLGREVAEALEQGLMANAKQTDLAITYAFAVGSSIFDVGWTYTGLEVLPGYENRLTAERTMDWTPPPMRPRSWFVRSCHVFNDPTCHPSRAAYIGHVWIKPASALKAIKDENGAPLFDAAAVDAMQIDSAADEVRRMGAFGEWARRTATRGDVVGYTVWCRDTQLEYTLAWKGSANTGEAQWLRDPRPMMTHPDGPYTAWGSNWWDDEPFPFPITAAMQTIVTARDLHRKKLDEDARSAMRLLIADGKANAQKLADARNKRILNWPGFKGMFAQIDTGGMQKESLEYEAKLAQEEAQTTSVTTNRQGNLDSGIPATAILDASQELDAQRAFMRDNVEKAASAERSKAAWLMYHMRSVQFPVTVYDKDTGQELNGAFVGGRLPDEQGLRYEDFRFTIKQGSMGHNSTPAAVAEIDMVLGVVERILALSAHPGANIQGIADMAFDRMNIQGGARRLLYPRVLGVMQEMAAAQMGAAAVGGVMGAGAGPQGAAGGPPPPGTAKPPMPPPNASPSPGRAAAGGSPGAGDVRSVGAKIGAQTKQGQPAGAAR